MYEFQLQIIQISECNRGEKIFLYKLQVLKWERRLLHFV